MSKIEQEIAKWEEQKNLRLSHGDKLEVPREVEHFASFTSKSNAHTAGEKLVANGFQVFSAKRGLFGIDIKAVRSDSMTSYEDVISLVLGIVQEYGGKYDGFGAEIVE